MECCRTTTAKSAEKKLSSKCFKWQLLFCCAFLVRTEAWIDTDERWKWRKIVKTNSKIENAKLYSSQNASTHSPARLSIFISIFIIFIMFFLLPLLSCSSLDESCHHSCHKMPAMMKRKIIEILLLSGSSILNHIKTICIRFLRHIITRTKQTNQPFSHVPLVSMCMSAQCDCNDYTTYKKVTDIIVFLQFFFFFILLHIGSWVLMLVSRFWLNES